MRVLSSKHLAFLLRLKHLIFATLASTFFMLLSACTVIPDMEVQEVFYLAVASGENTNYYRVTIKADGDYGVAKYESGWFPREAVDRLYGTGDDFGPKQLLEEEALDSAFDEAYRKAYQAYLNAASDPMATEEEISRLLIALKRVRAVPGEATPLPNGAKEIEFDPLSNKTLFHSGEKFVIAFSSDPSETLKHIGSIADSNKVGKSIFTLSEIMTRQSLQDVQILADEEQHLARMFTLISTSLSNSGATLSAEEGVTQANVSSEFSELRGEIERMLSLTESAL